MDLKFQEYTVELQKFDQYLDLEEGLSFSDISLILGEESDWCGKFYTIIFCNDLKMSEKVGFGICQSSNAVSPSLQYINNGLMLIGYNTSIFGYNLHQKREVLKIDNESVFYRFIYYPAKELVIAVFETGVFILDNNLKQIKQLSTDIIESVKIHEFENKLLISCLDGEVQTYSF